MIRVLEVIFKYYVPSVSFAMMPLPAITIIFKLLERNTVAGGSNRAVCIARHNFAKESINDNSTVVSAVVCGLAMLLDHQPYEA